MNHMSDSECDLNQRSSNTNKETRKSYNQAKTLAEKSPYLKGICMTDTKIKDMTCPCLSFTQNVTIVVLGFIAYSVTIIVSWHSLQK